MKTTEQYFPVVLFIMLYKAVLTFDQAVLFRGTVYYAVLTLINYCLTVWLTRCFNFGFGFNFGVYELLVSQYSSSGNT